jgi:hypothetical protein
MERNKWEAEFKEKLNQREITPTPHAWQRLDAMLNASESKPEKPVRRLTWLYIAAGFAGIILIATLFFKQGKADAETQVVEQPKQQTEQPKNGLEPSKPDNREQVAETQLMPVQEFKTGEASNSNKPIPGNTQNTRVVQTTITQKPSMPSPGFSNAIPAIENKETSVSGAKDDEQWASVTPKVQQAKTVKVDAHSLLSQVDGELDLTFREKTIKTINKKYQNVKVALANRNNQE